MTKLDQLLQKYCYNEPYESQFGFEGSPYFHIGDEQYPYNQYMPFGQEMMERPRDLDRMENIGKDGEEFPEFSEFRKRKNKRLKRLKLLRKLMQEKKNTVLDPAPYYASEYGSLTGVEGLNAYPTAYYSAYIADNPDAVLNPWNNIYQSASNTIQERVKLRSLFFNNFVKTAGVIEDLQAKYPKLNIKEISQRDPSHTNKYLRWMVKQLDLGINPNNLYPSIEYFHNNIHKFKEKDINRYDGISLEEAIKNLPKQQSKTQEKNK
jgi:hypothetical protein